MATSQDARPDAAAPGADDALLAAVAPGRPYGSDTQLLVIGVHGTNNGPQNVRDVTNRIGSALSDQSNVGKAVIDTGFDWTRWSGTTNQTSHREVAAGALTAHTLTELDEAYRSGALDRGKPLVIMDVGFSHGGNVALQASDVTALGLNQRGITNAAIHDVTLSTPAYTWGEESPAAAAQGVQRNGVSFAHTHFSVAGDGVIRGAIGNANYPGPGHLDGNQRDGITTNVNMVASSGLDGIANHGAPQDSEAHMDVVVNRVSARFRGLAPPSQLRSEGETDMRVASGAAPARDAFANGHPLRAAYAGLQQGVASLDADALRGARSEDVAAALLDRAVKDGFDPGTPMSVIAGGQQGTVFATQGDFGTGQRVRLDVADVTPGSAATVSQALQAAPAAQVAMADAPERARAM